jgi:hypothetical protein
MTETTAIREGQYYLNEFYMTTPSKNLSLREICARADIYESILEPVVRAEFIIADAKGVFAAFDPVDKEKIVIEFTTTKDAAPIRYEFFPIKQEPTVSTSDDKAVVYKLTCITEEAKKAKNIKSIPFLKDNTEAENIIIAALNTVETKKNFFFEKTQGLHGLNLTSMTPFEVIDLVRVNAMSAKYQGHAFCFFENSKGFVFKSIEALIEEGKKKIGDKYFLQSALANVSVTGSKWRNILALKVIQRNNKSIGRMIGGFNNQVQQYNVKTGEVTTFDNKPDDFQFVTLNEGSNDGSQEALKEFKKDAGSQEQVPFNPDVENAEIARKRNALRYYMTHFLNIICHITVYGDSNITAGDVITCEIPEHDGLTIGEDKAFVRDSQIVAGNYLITKCRHILSFNERAEYLQSYEIVKDGIGGNMPRATRF